MSELPGDLLYTKDHEWLRREDDGSVTIGITDHAATALGDLVYVELPEVEQDVESQGEMAVVESVKAASDVYAPIAGTVAAVNDDPVVALPGGAVSFTEGDGATVIDATAAVTDVDSADFDTGTLTVDLMANGTANDRLAIRD